MSKQKPEADTTETPEPCVVYVDDKHMYNDGLWRTLFSKKIKRPAFRCYGGEKGKKESLGYVNVNRYLSSDASDNFEADAKRAVLFVIDLILESNPPFFQALKDKQASAVQRLHSVKVAGALAALNPDADFLFVTSYGDLKKDETDEQVGDVLKALRESLGKDAELLIRQFERWDNARVHAGVRRLINKAAARINEWEAATAGAAFAKAVFTLPEYEGVRVELDLLSEVPDTIVFTGDTGSGKELAARYVHNRSRPKGQFQVADLPTVVDTLFEVELFGGKKGAYTGLDFDRLGLVKAATDGTLFLDEIGDCGPAFQQKLLRLIDRGEYRPVGEESGERFNGRIMVATRRNLAALVTEGKFRDDLFFRLEGREIAMPPVKDAKSAVSLFRLFWTEMGHDSDRLRQFLRDADFEAMVAASEWPGNLRSIKSFVNFCASPSMTLARASEELRRREKTILPAREARIVPSSEEAARQLLELLSELKRLLMTSGGFQ